MSGIELCRSLASRGALVACEDENWHDGLCEKHWHERYGAQPQEGTEERFRAAILEGIEAAGRRDDTQQLAAQIIVELAAGLRKASDDRVELVTDRNTDDRWTLQMCYDGPAAEDRCARDERIFCRLEFYPTFTVVEGAGFRIECFDELDLRKAFRTVCQHPHTGRKLNAFMVTTPAADDAPTGG